MRCRCVRLLNATTSNRAVTRAPQPNPYTRQSTSRIFPTRSKSKGKAARANLPANAALLTAGATYSFSVRLNAATLHRRARASLESTSCIGTWPLCCAWNTSSSRVISAANSGTRSEKNGWRIKGYICAFVLREKTCDIWCDLAVKQRGCAWVHPRDKQSANNITGIIATTPKYSRQYN